jgi:cell division FtsZ-interacting protein ZapD
MLTQNQHLAPSTQQAEQSWLNTCVESEACQSIFLKLTKDEKQLDKNLALVGWYQTVPHLQLESQVKRHIATTSYLSAV